LINYGDIFICFYVRRAIIAWIYKVVPICKYWEMVTVGFVILKIIICVSS